MVDAMCPVCGKAYAIPEGRGREMVVTKFLSHKDTCKLPEEDEFVKVTEYAPETRPGRYTILEHLDLSADQIRDAYREYAQAISS